MKKIVRLTESELTQLVKRIIKEQGVENENLPIAELVIGNDFNTSYVKLENGEQYPVKFSMSDCPKGKYMQKDIPNGCYAIFKLNNEIKYCNNEGCGDKSITIQDVTVSRMGKNYSFQLKEPIDNFDMVTYDIKTGEIRGDGQKEHIVARTQPNQTKEWVISWFKRNGIKIFKF
jgi:hypothetical protein